jgi:uncharacterized protein involved in cysteine biosynthesis
MGGTESTTSLSWGYAALMHRGSRQTGGPLRELGRGAAAFVGGISFVIRTPGVLGWALVPAGVAVGTAVGLASLAVWTVVRASERLLRGGGGLGVVERALFDVLFGGVGVFAAVVVAVGIAQPLTRIALDRIASPLDAARPPGAQQLRPPSGLLASLGVALSALGITLPTVGALELATLFAPEAAPLTEPIAFLVSALGLAWELLDHPFSRRGLGAGERLRWIKESFFAVLGFAAAAQVFLLVPGLDFFLLPVGIAGATRLFAEREKQPGAAPGHARDERGGPIG